MPEKNLVTLTDADGTTVTVAPELGGWLLRYARPIPEHGLVDALHYSQAVVDRYPREMYAGIPVLFPLVSNNRVGDKDHHYEWNGKVFEMPQHGFARRHAVRVHIDEELVVVAVEGVVERCGVQPHRHVSGWNLHRRELRRVHGQRPVPRRRDLRSFDGSLLSTDSQV